MNTIQVNHLGHISNISHHLFNFIPDEWNCSHMRLCKYKRSCLPADSAAWKLTLMTTVCYFRSVQEALPSWSPGCEAWALLPSTPAYGAWTSYVPEGPMLPDQLSLGLEAEVRFWQAVYVRGTELPHCNWGIPKSCLEDPKHLRFSITFKYYRSYRWSMEPKKSWQRYSFWTLQL